MVLGENQSGEERLKDNSPLIIHVCDIAKATTELQLLYILQRYYLAKSL